MRFISARKVGALLLPLVIASTAIAAGTASARSSHSGAGLQACALLPDTKSSTRYTLFDAPYLKAAFKEAGVSAQVLNAQGSAARRSRRPKVPRQGREGHPARPARPGLGRGDHERGRLRRAPR